MNPSAPIYIPSKGRHETRLTVRALDAMRVPYRVIVEEQEHAAYASVIEPSRLLVLDPAYQRAYDPCDELGDSKSKGSGPARNFAWDHAIASGADRHWLIDDNIIEFRRPWQNRRVRVADGTIFRCMEDFADRYTNVALAGPAYQWMAFGSSELPPIVMNTRIFSCILIRNDIPFRWRARYNEDVDLSLRVLKAGWCTVQFNAFLQNKSRTQTMRGGNTDEIYKSGTGAKSRMIVALHPDVCYMKWKFGRCHHHCVYKRFARTKLRRKPGVEIAPGVNEYGMRLVQAA